MDEYKLKLSKIEKELQNRIQEITQKTQKICELQALHKRDEAVIKKTMLENEKLKKQKPLVEAPKVKKEEMVLPDVEEIKTKFMDRLTS